MVLTSSHPVLCFSHHGKYMTLNSLNGHGECGTTSSIFQRWGSSFILCEILHQLVDGRNPVVLCCVSLVANISYQLVQEFATIHSILKLPWHIWTYMVAYFLNSLVRLASWLQVSTRQSCWSHVFGGSTFGGAVPLHKWAYGHNYVNLCQYISVRSTILVVKTPLIPSPWH